MASWRCALALCVSARRQRPDMANMALIRGRAHATCRTCHAHATRSVAVIVVFPFNYAKQIFAFCIRNPRNQTKPNQTKANQQCPQSLSRAAICAATAPHRSSLTMLDLPRAIVITVRGTHAHTHRDRATLMHMHARPCTPNSICLSVAVGAHHVGQQQQQQRQSRQQHATPAATEL